MRILVNFATRSRPSKFLNCIRNIREHAVDNNQVDILVKADWDDNSMRDIEMPEGIKVEWGVSTSKIHAINRDVPTDGWDILINFSDDQLFVKYGWDVEVRDAFEQHGLDTIIHWPDNCPYRERLIAMSIIGKEYYDRFGYVYHPSYFSLWCDNEFMDVSKALVRYRYMGGPNHDNILSHHIHPAHIKGLEYDDQLRKTEAYYHIDEKNYNERKARNFDL
jgi:hypothetical protein